METQSVQPLTDERTTKDRLPREIFSTLAIIKGINEMGISTFQSACSEQPSSRSVWQGEGLMDLGPPGSGQPGFHLPDPSGILGPSALQIPTSSTGRGRGRNESKSVWATVNSFIVFIVKKLQLEHGTLKLHNHGLFFQRRKEKIHIYKNCKHVHLNIHT